MHNYITISQDINLNRLAQKIAHLDHEEDITDFIIDIVGNAEDFDFEMDLVLRLFEDLELNEVLKDKEYDNQYIKEFLLDLKEKIDICLKEIRDLE